MGVVFVESQSRTEFASDGRIGFHGQWGWKQANAGSWETTKVQIINTIAVVKALYIDKVPDQSQPGRLYAEMKGSLA
jgi:hypothetical protein